MRRSQPARPASNNRLEPSTPLIASTRLDTAPAWSPDGTKIAFLSDRSGDFELWICDADGSNPVRLTAFDGPSVLIVSLTGRPMTAAHFQRTHWSEQ